MITSSFVPAFAWLGIFAAALGLHLRLHPARECFRGGLRALGQLPLVAGLFFVTHSLSFVMQPLPGPAAARVEDWPGVLGACVLDGVTDLAWLMHDAARLRDLGLPAVLLLPFQALLAAALQVWLCLALPEGEKRRRPLPPANPPDPTPDSRLRPVAPIESRVEPPAPPTPSLLPRWRGILLLAAIHAFIVAALRLGSGRAGAPLHFLGVEFLFCFMPLSFAAAHSTAGFLNTGVAMLRIWRAAWLPWLGWAVSAFALLTLLSFALRVIAAQTFAPDALRWMAGGLFSSALHAWLLASCVLLLRRTAYVGTSPSALP